MPTSTQQVARHPPPLSRTVRALNKFQICRVCHGDCVVRLLRMKRRDSPPGRAPSANRRPRRSNFRYERPVIYRCMMALPVSTSWFPYLNAKLREPSNAARPGVKWVFFNCSIRGVCDRDMGAVSRDFAEVGWRRGLGARKPRSGVRSQRNEAGFRHGRERGAGGRPRRVWWPR